LLMYKEYNEAVSGNSLNHLDWQVIHAPGLQLYIFQKDEAGEFETDGHYSTIYLIGKMLGIPKYNDLAFYTEAPDNLIHDKFAIVQTTWAEKDHQLLTHALTWGYHSEEEFLTSVAFLNAEINDYQEMGRLLHRYGDCYAHTRLEDDSKPYREKRMYGDTITWKFYIFGITYEHFSVDKSKPDMIANRPNWYMEYVRSVAELLSIKFKVNLSKVNFQIFQQLADYAVLKKVSLIGIINYQIAKIENKNKFTIPYPKSDGRSILSVGATGNAREDYEIWVANTKEYLDWTGVKYVVEREIRFPSATPSIDANIQEATFFLK